MRRDLFGVICSQAKGNRDVESKRYYDRSSGQRQA